MKASNSSQESNREENEDAGGDITASSALSRMRAENKRMSQIRQLVVEAAKQPGADLDELETLAASAEGEGWDSDRFELEILRAARPKGPAIRTVSKEVTGPAVEAALCLSAGLKEANVEKWYGDRAIEAASSPRMRGMSLSEVVHLCITASGRYARPGRLTNDAIRSALEADRSIRASGAGFSTISLSGILGNVANKQLLESYQAVESVLTKIAAASDYNDFKQGTRYRMTGTGVLEKVGPDGELKHANLTEAGYNNQLDTYGRIISLTRTMMINDDLGAFLQIPKIFGRQAALALELAGFTLLLSNPSSFFSSGNDNYQEGAGTVLSIAGFTTAEQLFLDQTDADGRPILVSPKILLVPTSLKVTAQQLMTELRVNEAATAGAPKPANNPHAGKCDVLASPYLNSQGLSGSSSTAWYIFADPNDIPVMEVGYLRGQKSPTVESGEGNFDTLGMQWRSFFDFGVAMQDQRGGIKSKGAA